MNENYTQYDNVRNQCLSMLLFAKSYENEPLKYEKYLTAKHDHYMDHEYGFCNKSYENEPMKMKMEMSS